MNPISPTADPTTEVRRATGDAPVDPHGSRSLTAQARQDAMAAARYAEHAYPGPIGEVLSRELRNYAEDGEQLPPHASAPRLISAVQRQQARNPLPPAPGYAHLPAQYIPGSALRWRYRTAADSNENTHRA
ncbi:MAG: hypothetical protein V7633_476 [Pseudonocardia sp.]|jgi:hypothetical protein